MAYLAAQRAGAFPAILAWRGMCDLDAAAFWRAVKTLRDKRLIGWSANWPYGLTRAGALLAAEMGNFRRES